MQDYVPTVGRYGFALRERCTCTCKGGHAIKRRTSQRAGKTIEIENRLAFVCFLQDKLADVA